MSCEMCGGTWVGLLLSRAPGSDDSDDDEERPVYEFADIESLGVEAFQSIYETPNPGL